ncbi:thiamine phosphate synthase [Hydrogenimonas sp.]
MLRYAITDPAHYGRDPEDMARRVAEVLGRQRVDAICLRDKHADDYAALAQAFQDLAPRFPGTRFLLHTDWRLAATLGAHGVHLPANAYEEVPRAKAAGLWTVLSTHTLEEALRAQALGADAVTYSPIFETPGKGAPKGLEKLKEIKDKISITLIALGGIVTPDQIDAVERAGADGFASIRYFVNPLQGNRPI